jgi:hypothetical protein
MAGVNLDMGKLDGSTVNEKDFRKLYFVYLSSKTEDWNFILEVLFCLLTCLTEDSLGTEKQSSRSSVS